jgi:hypothetical protein
MVLTSLDKYLLSMFLRGLHVSHKSNCSVLVRGKAVVTYLEIVVAKLPLQRMPHGNTGYPSSYDNNFWAGHS